MEIRNSFEGLEVKNEDQGFQDEDFPAPPDPGSCEGRGCKCRPRMSRIDRKKGCSSGLGMEV